MSNVMNKWLKMMGVADEENTEVEAPAYDAGYDSKHDSKRDSKYESKYDFKHREREEETNSGFGLKKGKVVNIHTTTQLKVVVIQPTSYNDSQDVADHLKSKKPVVVNLERLEKEDARKMVDFLSGAVYALDGSMQKVASGILLLAPYNVGIMGDFSSELKSNGLFDLN